MNLTTIIVGIRKALAIDSAKEVVDDFTEKSVAGRKLAKLRLQNDILEQEFDHYTLTEIKKEMIANKRRKRIDYIE